MATANQNEPYFADNRISSTELRTLATQGERGLVNYLTSETEETSAMLFGTLAHCLVLEPNELEKRFFVMPKIDGRTKEGKEAKAKALEEAGERSIIDEETLSRARLVAEQAAPFIRGNSNEVEYYTDTAKAKPDSVHLELGIGFDLKSVSNFEAAAKTIWTSRLDLQAGHYANVLAANGVYLHQFNFVMAETVAPFRVRNIIFTGSVLELAKQEAAIWEKKVRAIKAKHLSLEQAKQDTPEIVAEYPDWISLKSREGEEEF